MANDKNFIKSVLREGFGITEEPKAPEEGETNSEGEEMASDGDYDRVNAILKNDLINHAGVINLLWGSKNATMRSKFRKMLLQEPNDSGGTYAFTKVDMSKLISILDNLQKEVHTNIKKGDY